MRMVDLIEKKKKGMALTTEEIQAWIKGYVSGEIPDYQVSALLMAIVFKGMNETEIFDLTMTMMQSGDVIDLSGIQGVKCDKHSTGGVGDKTSLVLGPMAAACGLPIAKMSGRGLGFTGGTIDKLESIDGFQVNLAKDAFIRQVNETGIAIAGQSGNLVPADKKLYALRDVTGTVDAIPLIASSIMSKKLAAGSDVIVLDVKYGSGAFMPTPEAARELAETMLRIGRRMGRKCRAVISSMEAPLGMAIGNALEVREAIDTLRGQGPEDLKNLCLCIGSLMLVASGKAADVAEAEQMLQTVLDNGQAFEKLVAMTAAQGGDTDQLRHPERLPQAAMQTGVICQKTGYIHRIQALALGNLAMQIGAGRAKKEDSIRPEVGIVLCHKVGDFVEEGETLAVVHHAEALPENWINDCRQAFATEAAPAQKIKLIDAVL